MGQILTLAFIVMVVVFFLFRLRAANREAVKRDEREKEEKIKRAALEKDILDRLGRLKEKDDLKAAQNAIHRDPKRAAKVLSKMMRDK